MSEPDVPAPAPPATGAPQPLFLHVGLPKSGTTFLQRMLATNRDALKAAGFVYPFVRREGMFHAAVELREQHERWGLEPAKIDGTWDLLLRRARNFDGAAVISHEILAGSRDKTITRIVDSTADFELHVVITLRDLARQAVAYWQEQVKNGRPWTFAEFRRDVADHVGEASPSAQGSGFWRSQDLESVLGRWHRAVPAERLHIVVAPPAGAAPDELWLRFCAALGLDPTVASPADVPRTNASLDVGQIALLRQVNAALGDRLGQPHYAHVVKRLFAQRLLPEVGATLGGGRRPVTPPDLAARFDEVVDGWTRTITAAGYTVHGSLDDLRAGTPPGAAPSSEPPLPDDVSDAEVLRGVPEVIAGLLLEIADLRSNVPGPRQLPPVSEGHALRHLRTGTGSEGHDGPDDNDAEDSA